MSQSGAYRIQMNFAVDMGPRDPVWGTLIFDFDMRCFDPNCVTLAFDFNVDTWAPR